MKQELSPAQEKLWQEWFRPFRAQVITPEYVRQFLCEALASDDLLWRYYNDRRFHTFVQLRCAESIEAYKDHKPAPEAEFDQQPDPDAEFEAWWNNPATELAFGDGMKADCKLAWKAARKHQVLCK